MNPDDLTYKNWKLSTYGQVLLPRTVYVKFRDSSGKQYGPYQDDIILDTTRPRLLQVDLLSSASQVTTADSNNEIIFRVSASDENSGVETIQVSNSSDFSSSSDYSMNGNSIDITWSFQPLGAVYLRAIDRAGNQSDVHTMTQAGGNIYLPLIVTK